MDESVGVLEVTREIPGNVVVAVPGVGELVVAGGRVGEGVGVLVALDHTLSVGPVELDESLDVDVLRESWLRPEARTLEQVSSRTIALITSKSSRSSHTDVWHHDFFPRDPRALATRTRA